MKSRYGVPTLAIAIALVGCGGAAVEAAPPTAQVEVEASGEAAATAGASSLSIGGATANFGVHEIAPGFVPDPRDISVVSGGDLDASTLGLAAGCNGWLTRQPDIIVRLTGTSPMLRFYVTSNGGEDTTLVVNGADAQYHCNDDSYGGTNPSVDIANAGAGQYDVWVGSYQQGVRANAVLHVTELDQNHP